MTLGMFDGEPSAQPYGKLGPKDVCSTSHQELALEAARQGIVLLKNDGPVLPLSRRRHPSVAVIGPNSDATLTMIGNYAGIPCGYTTPLQGIGKYTRTIHEADCGDIACANDTLFGGAVGAARQADATVLVMGLDQSIEAEFVDRAGLLLPGCQQELISKVASASKGPTILVLMSGGPVDVSFAHNDPRIGAILWAGYPGQAGGAAISSPPGGDWAPQKQLVAFEKVSVRAGEQRRVGVSIRVCKYLSVVDRLGVRRIPMGEHGLHIGDARHAVSLEAQTIGVIRT
ncbi:UNVERIFIED_CONTAM: putative beta-D-xylosidase [Sesamum radiatum]|uniref:Beta-D-xylosidase n=1 Tax=Sesamum radiatum TaxID=300843 RepID=A0AAW2IMJ5_SESRA